MLKYYAFIMGSWLLPIVPLGIGHSVASFIGGLLYRLQPAKRKIVSENVACVLCGRNEKLIAEITQKVFRNSAQNYFDIFKFPNLDRATTQKVIKTRGWDNFLAAYAQKKGVIAITAHFGYFDVAGQLLVSRSIKTTIPAEPLNPPQVFQLFKRMREREGITVVPVGPAGLRAVIQALRRGELVCMAVDRDIQHNGRLTPFFCGEVSFPTGVVELALRTGALLVPAFGYRLPDGTLEVVIDEAFNLIETGDREEDIRVNLEKIAKVLERHIGPHPEQWVVFEPMFQSCSRKELVDAE